MGCEMPGKFKLGRTKQCEKCPWKVSTDPYDIPDGYDPKKHAALASTIATPKDVRGSSAAMSCHEHPPGKKVMCVGWLANQMGPGNNIRLRIQMFRCENLADVQLDGNQHLRFEDTLPKRGQRRGKRAHATISNVTTSG
jgi:hypothetical protein